MSDDLSADLRSLKIDRTQNPERPRPFRIILIVAAIIAAGATAYIIGVPYLKDRVFKAEVTTTEIVTVSPAQASIEVTSTGYVRPQKVSNVGPKVAGRVSRVLVGQGDEVAAGAVLYELDVADQKAAVAEANARATAARAQVATARANLVEIQQQATRARDLADQGVRPQAAADDLAAREAALKQAVSAADADAKAAMASVAALQVRLDSYAVTTPIAGTVLSKPPEVGEVVVAAGSAETTGLVEIADFSTLAVETDVPEARLAKVEVGGPAEIVLDAFPGKRYRGKTIEIVPKINRAKATVPVKVTFVDEATRVLPEMSARVSFLGKEVDAEAIKEPPKLVVPDAALADRAGAKVVFVLDSGKVRMTPVQVGDPYAGGRILLQGPAAGTKVIKNPSETLRDGQAVEERSDG